MKLAVAIKSCHKYAERRKAQLETWLRDVDVDFFFLVGNPTPGNGGPVIVDTLACDVSDAFQNIAPKVLFACEYALDQNITNLLICDDDTYIRWAAMMRSGFEKFDYVGHLRTDDIDYNRGVPYAQGSAYWLSAHSMEFVALNIENKMRDGVIDDGAVGQVLDGHVALTHDRRYWPGPFSLPDKELLSIHKCSPAEMKELHHRDQIQRGK